MKGSFRGVAAAFNAIAMVGVAYSMAAPSYVQIWGSALAAVAAALVVLTNGAVPVGWIAVGYMVFAGLGAGSAVSLDRLPLLLAVAFMPLLPRPLGSLPLGLSLTAMTAVGLWLVYPFVPAIR